MGAIVAVLIRRPAATLFVVRAAISCAMSFGLSFTAEQMTATMLLTEAIFALFGDATTTPNAKLDPGTVALAKMGEKP